MAVFNFARESRSRQIAANGNNEKSSEDETIQSKGEIRFHQELFKGEKPEAEEIRKIKTAKSKKKKQRKKKSIWIC